MLNTVSQDKVIDFTNIKYNVIIHDTPRIFSKKLTRFFSIAFVHLAFYTHYSVVLSADPMLDARNFP